MNVSTAPRSRAPDIQLAGLRVWVDGRHEADTHDYWDGNWVTVLAQYQSAQSQVTVAGPLVHLSEIVTLHNGCTKLAARQVQVLLSDGRANLARDGSLWVGTANGAAHIADGRVQVVDVRDASEFNDALGHIASARHIPLAELAARSAELDPARPVVAVCRSGTRSAQACVLLGKAGFTQVANLAGGMLRWQAERLPVEGTAVDR